MTLADQDSDDEEMGMTIDEYNDVLHLCFIPNIVDVVEPYLGLPTPLVPSLLDCIASSPSHITVTDNSNKENEDPNHPGEGWMKYNPNCGDHYPFVFSNKEQRPEMAKYIWYLKVGKDTHHLGTRGKNEVEHLKPLHACAFPEPSFTPMTTADTDLHIFHPDHLSCLIVNNALVELKDPGVITVTATKCAVTSRLNG